MFSTVTVCTRCYERASDMSFFNVTLVVVKDGQVIFYLSTGKWSLGVLWIPRWWCRSSHWQYCSWRIRTIRENSNRPQIFDGQYCDFLVVNQIWFVFELWMKIKIHMKINWLPKVKMYIRNILFDECDNKRKIYYQNLNKWLIAYKTI